MNVRGLVLMGFSLGCLAVAGLAHHQEKQRSMSLELARTMDQLSCGDQGFDTPFGRVSCLTQVSFPLMRGVLGNGSDYFGGNTLNSGR